MKKQGIYILVLLTGIFAAFVTGLFIGRNLNRQQLSLDVLQAETTAQEASSDETYASSDATAAAPAVTDGKVNINTATLEQLKTLPGIGDVLAQRIIDYRAANGSFASVAELLNVSGIGEKRLEAILDQITTGG